MLHQIGAGALGPVFRAYEPERDRLVAVKLFRLDLPPERVHQLVAEFEPLIAADLVHPAIAAPLATGIDGVSAYLAQEYVTADSLDIVVRENGPASPADGLRVATRLAEALDYAAARKIVHGAIHPRDVLLSTDELRLVGLGVTRALERVGVTAPVRRPYTAPERIGGGAWDRRADVFSLAAVMYELMWGRRLAGTGAQAADAVTEIAGANLAALRGVFARALADDMADRYATATEFASALADAFEGVAAAARVARLPPGGSRRSAAPRPVAEPRLPLEDDRDEPDLALRAPEPPRYHEVDAEVQDLEVVAPSTLIAAGFWHQPRESLEPVELLEPVEPLEPLVERDARVAPTFAGSFLSPPAPVEPSRLSLVWPLALAAVVGSALGFGAGYAVAIRDRHNAGAAGNSASVAAPAALDQPAGREFTEGTVGAPQKRGDVRLKPDATDSKRADAKTNAVGPAKPAATVIAPATKPTGPAAPAALPASKPVAAATAGVARLAAPLFAGRVLVRSTPPGARVFVDGRSGGETPATVRDLARGTHQVRLVREGYTTVERRIAITASKPALTLTVPMAKVQVVPARLDSALVIESKPAGATVFLDGRQVGTTPMAIPSVRVGAHSVRIELDGYRHWSSSTQVMPTEQNRVTASLER